MNTILENLRAKTLSSMPSGFDAFWLFEALNKYVGDVLYVVSNGFEIEQTAEILKYLNPDLEVLTLPAWDTVPFDRVSPNVNVLSKRIETLSKIAHNPNTKKNRLIITSVGAAIQRLPLKKIFLNSEKNIKIGSAASPNLFAIHA